MSEIGICRCICLGISSILGSLLFIGLFDVSDDSIQCHIDNITYPRSFNSSQWIDCGCDTPFCLGICYCIKLFANNTFIQNDITDDTCTIKSDVIPFNLDFTNIIYEYQNKTVKCWQNDSGILYLNGHIMKNNLRVLMISILIVTSVGWLMVEIITGLGKQQNKEEINVSTDLPIYNNDTPPPYNQEV